MNKDNIVKLYEDMILLESLDSPYHLTNVNEHNPVGISKMNDLGFTNVNFYSCEEPGHFFMTGERNGMLEVHHQNVSSGEETNEKNVMGKTPSRFVATAYHLMKPHIDSGHVAKVIASDNHIGAYHRLSKAIGRKHEYNVSDVSRTEDGHHSFLIGKVPSPLFGMKINS